MFRVSGLACRVEGVGCRVEGGGFGVIRGGELGVDGDGDLGGVLHARDNRPCI